jgi:hypothetical protein
MAARAPAAEPLAVTTEAAARIASATRSGPTADASRIDSTRTVQSAPPGAADGGAIPLTPISSLLRVPNSYVGDAGLLALHQPEGDVG